MDCRETRALVHGYVDDELDLMTSLDIERHLQACPGCARALADVQAVRAAVKGLAPYYRTPPGLAGRVRASLRGAGRAGVTPRLRAGRLAAVTAALVLVLGAGWWLARVRPDRPDGAFLARELAASHVRSQMLASHRFDVASTDPHTVKPWFEGKLDFSPPVKDLADQGFPLVGGRLDYLNNRPVAALVYQRRKHTINLFVWPSSPGDASGAGQAAVQGFHMIRFQRPGMTFWAVSDLNEAELHEFVRLVQE